MDIVNRLHGAKFFTKFDVRWGYHNIRIKKGDEWKAVFTTSRGLFKPQVMLFGLTNSPATFQALMNTIFVDLVAAGQVAIYLDDILIYSPTLEEHRRTIHEVLQHLRAHDLYLRPEKCEFEQEEVEYLGLIIRRGEVTMDPTKSLSRYQLAPSTQSQRAARLPQIRQLLSPVHSRLCTCHSTSQRPHQERHALDLGLRATTSLQLSQK